jgi:hypothetical protein
LVFNLYYALLLGNTYSLSSVTGINELFINIATGAFLALLAAWLFYYLTNRLYRNLPSRAILLNLDMLLVVVYLLSLPYLLNFILNGFRVTWTLPDFLTTFVGFLSLLQVLMVALLGLLLVGLSGLIARIISRKSVASEN